MARSLVNEVYKAPGLSDFVDISSTISVPYTSIVNRAKIPDIANDLSVKMGVERIPIQSLYQLQNEFGASGEPVWAALNDDKNLIRLVGSWGAADVFNGPGVRSTASGNFIEIVFYGTGLNLLVGWPSSGATVLVTVDGGTEGVTNIHPTGHSGILNARNYAPNGVIPVVSNLSLGVHTVRLRHNSAITWDVHGFEILNAASTLIVNPGTAYSAGSKKTLASQQTPAFNSGFTNVYGIAGTRGGRVLTYLASDGTVKKDIQYVNTAAAYLSSASHADEEVIRTYHFREFGAGRLSSTDDFSTLTVSGSNRVFTLDDGTTTLSAYNCAGYTQNGLEVLGPSSLGFWTLTFVGTGLDLVLADSVAGGNDSYTYQIDGGTAVAWPNTAGNTTLRVQKIVSGLPYGTHTFRLNRITAATWVPGVSKFIVYGPKKPSLPTGAMELADYNIMADYSQAAAANNGYVSSGTLRKQSTREHVYVNTWTSITPENATFQCGMNFQTSTSGAYLEYTFFGTGVEWRGYVNALPANYTISIDGSSNFTVSNGSYWSGALSTSLQYGSTGLTFTASTGTLTGTVAAGSNVCIKLNGLTLGVHKIRVTTNNTSTAYSDCIDIITPIHSPKSSLVADLQNTLPVGSCAISDNRKTSAIKESLPAQKAWAQAVGVSSGPTTSSASDIPMPDMSTTIKVSGNAIHISYSAGLNNTTASYCIAKIYVNGVAVGSDKGGHPIAGANLVISDSLVVPVSPGTHKIDVYWRTFGGVMGAQGVNRNLTVREI